MRIKGLKFHRASLSRALRALALSVSVTALCLLPSPGVPEAPLHAAEASLFRSGPALPAAASGTERVCAVPGEVVPLGGVFGIKLFTDGVIVASLSDIYTENGVCCPAAQAGIKPGDYLLEANGRTLAGNAELARIIGGSSGEAVTLKVKRGDSVFDVSVTPVFGGGSFKTGMWVRDSAAGIGTLTFYDPATGAFAGLGHGICDADTNGVMALKSGEPAPITLCGVDKSRPDSPGRLKGYFSSDDALGTLTANNETGVYGVLEEAPAGKTVRVLQKDQVKPGPVKIMVTLDETGPGLYDGEITRIVARDQPTKNLVLRVTDERLLEETGGIVQGMSGCPILQDGMLAGAVTHVFTEDPASGFGIFAQNMCEALAAAAS